MKNIFLMCIAASSAMSVAAQSTVAPAATAPKAKKEYTRDSALSPWVLDVNLMGGFMSKDVTSNTSTAGYLNGLNLRTGKLTFDNGTSLGFNAQLGYFFGPKRHIGLGVGFMYLSQQGDLNLSEYHVEYQADRLNGPGVFRQHITGNNLTESVSITNMNIPVMLKYKTRFSKRFGFTADLGPVLNVQMKNTTTTNANFDYEAINKFQRLADGTVTNTYIFDNAVTPTAENSELITKAYYNTINPGGNAAAWFDEQRTNSNENVGLARKPNNDKSTVSYTTASLGFMVQPSLSWYLSDKVALNFGVYYLYQSFKNNNVSNYALMNTAGDYSSTLNNVSSSIVQSYGANVGARFFFGKPKDTDKDGIPDRKDKCPDVWGIVQFQGCPDTDKDGIQDSEDSCRTIPGLAKFNGCPDTDGDGIPDRADECPTQPGPANLKGCPDRDGDGIIDKKDLCPDKPGLAQYNGCPDTDGDGIPDNTDQCPEVAGPASNNGCPLPPPPPPATPLSTPILFETNKTVVQDVSMPVLEVAVKTMKEDEKAIIIINGHADARGKSAYNKQLSLKRAQAVKKQLVNLGADAKRIKIVAHGESDPTGNNDTEEGRAENRRAVMTLNVD